MGKPNLKLADETPPRAPERDVLAEAIAVETEAALFADCERRFHAMVSAHFV